MADNTFIVTKSWLGITPGIDLYCKSGFLE